MKLFYDYTLQYHKYKSPWNGISIINFLKPTGYVMHQQV